MEAFFYFMKLDPIMIGSIKHHAMTTKEKGQILMAAFYNSGEEIEPGFVVELI